MKPLEILLSKRYIQYFTRYFQAFVKNTKVLGILAVQLLLKI